MSFQCGVAPLIATDHVPRVYHISCCRRLDDFMGELWEGLVEGKTDIPCGSCKHQWYVFMFNSPQLPHHGIWYYKGKPWTFPGKNSSAPPSATSKCDMESVPYESSDCVVNEPSTPLNGHGFRIPPYISCYCPLYLRPKRAEIHQTKILRLFSADGNPSGGTYKYNFLVRAWLRNDFLVYL